MRRRSPSPVLAVALLAAVALLSVPATTRANWPQGSGPPYNTPIIAIPTEQMNPRVVTDSRCGAIVIWRDFRDQVTGGTGLYMQRADSLGMLQWDPSAVPVCTVGSNNISDCSMVSDGAGGAITAWTDGRSFMGGHIYAQRVNSDGVPRWTTDGIPLCLSLREQMAPIAVQDGAGGAIVVWNTVVDVVYTEDLYAQRVDSTGATLWATNGVPVCTATDNQTFHAACADGAGGVIVVWSDYRSGNHTALYAQRLNSSGARMWAANGVPVCDASGVRGWSTIVSDGSGGAIVAWLERTLAGDQLVYAQHMNSAGVRQWAASGVPLTTAGPQVEAVTVSDGAGGAIVAWKDLRAGYAYGGDIYARRISSAGVPLWTADGVPLCMAPNDQEAAAILSDGHGGAIVTWDDYRPGYDVDIYAQRVDSAGTPRWTPDGAEVSIAPGYQFVPALASDGAGGAIIAWEDRRTGLDYDIYAQKLNAFGGLGSPVAVPEGGGRASVSFACGPNPARAASTLRWNLPREARVKLTVHDATGRLVTTLVDGVQPAGDHSARWNLRDSAGRAVPSGLYFVRLEADGRRLTRRLVALR